MERRLILAIVLALLVLLSWSAVVSRVYHLDNKGVTQKNSAPFTPGPITTVYPPEPAKEPAAHSLRKFSQEKYDIVFIEPQAAIKEIVFKAYQNYAFPLKYAFLSGDKNLLFQKQSVLPQEINFVYRDNDKQIVKRFIFPNSNYNIELEIEVQSLASAPISLHLPLVLGTLNWGGDSAQARLKDVTVAGQDRILHLNPRKDFVGEKVKFLGLRDRYFCAILQPRAAENYTAYIKKISPQEAEIGINTKEIILAPGQQIKQVFDIYLGPQELRYISRINPDWAAVVYYGTFDLISHGLLQLLGFIQRLVHNWGGAIIILSALIYLILYPLSLRQMRSMKQMQALQPAIEELRKLYKDNPQKLNAAIMELYREHKINPLSGCLPLILQIPVFFALYQALIRSVALKGANFLWIKDLSEPDRLFILPVSLPVLGNEINILPILMTIGMFVQQKMSLSTASAGSTEQQKLMLIIFPLMFGFIFYRMPAGLVLYWFVNSVLMLWYQFRISRSK